MKSYTSFIILSLSLLSFSQNKIEIEADYEMQGFFKNHIGVHVDSLLRTQFKYIREFESNHLDYKFERQRDFDVIESIYSIEIKFVESKSYKYKRYNVHVFTKNDTIFGLMNYDSYRDKINYYFDFEKLASYLHAHNQFYKSKWLQSDFINQVLANHVYGYACGYAPVVYKVPRYNNLSFNKKRNIQEFRSWLNSLNPELQTYAVDALEYLEKHKRFTLSELDKKLIATIKQRNSTLNTCSGCEIGLYEKVYN